MEFVKKHWSQIALGVIAVLIFAAGWWFARPAPVVETAAPAVTQEDGSEILERKPDANAKPKQAIPKGAKVERIEQVRVQGQGLKMPDGSMKTCPAVTVDMTVVREKDGGRRVIASSPDGEIVGGLDIPVETAAAPPEEPKWAAGVSLDPVRQAAGVWLERDVGPIRVGVDVNQRRSVAAFDGVEARVRVGWRF